MKARKILIFLAFAAVFAAFYLLDLGRYLTLESLKANRAHLETLRAAHAVMFAAVFVLVYVVQTAFSLPGAAILPGGHRAGEPGRKPSRARIVRTARPVRPPPHGPQFPEEAQGEERSSLGQEIEIMRASPEWTGWNRSTRIGVSLLLSVQFLVLGALPAIAAPKAVPWSFWAANDPAGQVRVDQGPWDRFQLSSIYDWFQGDFGGSEESVLRHLQKYANPELATRLKEFGGKFSYDYDWRINE